MTWLGRHRIMGLAQEQWDRKSQLRYRPYIAGNTQLWNPVPLAAGLPDWAKGINPHSIVSCDAGSIYVVGEGEAYGYEATDANEIEFTAAGQERMIGVRSINGTSSSPASDAIEIELWWSR